MPIRRAAATPSPEKAPSAAAEKEPEASPEESPSAGEEQAVSSAAGVEGEEGETSGGAEPAENGEKAEEASAEKEGEEVEKKEMKDGYKYEKSKAKKVKRTIPAWASMAARKNIPVTNYAGTQNKMDNILVEAIASSSDRSGLSFQSVVKYILKKYPGMDLNKKKFLLKKAMKKHLERGTIKQLKGKGLSGTFAIGKQPPASKKGAQKQEPLGDALPLIITRLCEPKEASYNLIKKYLEQHFPSFNIENRPDVLKTALVKAVEKGLLEQITGKGARGTFQLKRAGNKNLVKGSVLEDAITVAITAMNEPKTCSTTSLRKFLVDTNKDVRENQLVANLRRTLTKCKVLGWMEQITGHGFTGTYQLSFPFYPSPNILCPDKFKEPPKGRKTATSSDEEDEESEEEEDDESEDEAPRKRAPQRRPPPKARRPPPSKKSRSTSQSKAKSRGRALTKKSPAKKPAPRPKSSGRKQPAAKKESAPPPKETPVKRGTPSRKPKTPAPKKLSRRGANRAASRESSPEEPAVEKQTTRSGAKRIKVEDSSPEEPPAKKQATKGGSRRSEPKEPSPEPEVKKGAKGAKGGKQSARKSKRGRN
ncbi:heterochromatin protein 1-binding protein 3 isoform X2 [Cololabis saira]|uniref:heterochromatin protein 1-binding protein 3 isoform X2 n=1 Tax=Cololabis saira TaxID=129043 RepID=UPI002AD52010|nr:heterochromatin protein 1-binding protein 3 isoform X2 [Cololabis saira]